jgi:hypothetical protein
MALFRSSNTLQEYFSGPVGIDISQSYFVPQGDLLSAIIAASSAAIIAMVLLATVSAAASKTVSVQRL